MDANRGFETKTEWIYAQMRDMIAAGKLASGTRLPLARLADRFGTSEIPVREALRMLQRDGLVQIESHRGATVASVSWEQLYEAIVVRTHLEILAVAEATGRHGSESLARLRASLVRMDQLAATPSPTGADDFSATNREFHTALYDRCPYPLLIAEIQELWDRVWRTRSQSLFYMAREQMLRAQADHRAMYEAVAAEDVEEAVRLATVHREGNLAAWRRIIEDATEQLAEAPDVISDILAPDAAGGGSG